LNAIHTAMQDDLNTPRALEVLSVQKNFISESLVPEQAIEAFKEFLDILDKYFGLSLLNSVDITDTQKGLIKEREQGRKDQNWTKADEIRDTLLSQGIELRDTPHGQIWSRI
jgi:cysteinyl-tRNA synthetase